MAETKNALAELAKRLLNGLYINPNDKRFDGPVIVRTLDANDVLAAQRIVAELANLQFDANGKPNMYDTFHCAVNCRAIAEEGADNCK